MGNLYKTTKLLLAGKSIARIMLNRSFLDLSLKGRVLDVGGARNPDYFEYFNTDKMISNQIIDGKTHNINFEIDKLPFEDSAFDTLICANVLEHIYNYRFLTSEMVRVLKSGGELVGFVPFLIQYHPDPNDYFRYTKESLKKIFQESGFTDIKISVVGMGPFMTNFNNIMFIIPKILRPLIYFLYLFVSQLATHIKPALLERYPLSFTFVCKK